MATNKQTRTRRPGDDVGWPDIPFARGGSPPELVHVTEPNSLQASEVVNSPGFNVIYDFFTDRCYSFDVESGSETSICEEVAETLDQYEDGEL